MADAPGAERRVDARQRSEPLGDHEALAGHTRGDTGAVGQPLRGPQPRTELGHTTLVELGQHVRLAGVHEAAELFETQRQITQILR
mgnify:CR=1 FL=1